MISLTLGAFFAGLAFKGELYSYAGIPALICFVWYAFRSDLFSKGAETDLPIAETESIGVVKGRPARTLNVEESIASIRDRRRLYLQELEEVIDRTLLDALTVLRLAIGGHTLAIFVPHRVNGIYLRVWVSDSEHIVPGVQVVAGEGLVGLLLKEDVGRVLERDIVTDSSQLKYYSKNEGVRSIAGVPIIVKGVRRGALLADSLKGFAFDKKSIRAMENFSAMIGQFMYASYTSFENSYQRDQLAALTTYQRKFLENMSEKEIVGYLEDYIVQSIDADRFMLVGKKGEERSGEVLFCKGVDARYFDDFTFKFEEQGLVQLVFEKEQVIAKTFNRSEKVPRLSPRERINTDFKCLLAVPVRTDKGVTHVLTLESTKKNSFNEHQKELVMTIARAAGFALSRARIYEEKKEMSRKDGLTGLINHKTFQENYQQEIRRAERGGYLVTVMMLDIDFFKKVNDNYGHHVGDVVLKNVAQIISQIVDASHDTVARYGGEEFVCVLSQTNIAQAKETAERIRLAIQAKEYDVPGGVLKITMSIGAATYPTDSRYGKEVLEKSDKALYHAKKTGRNRIVFYSEGG